MFPALIPNPELGTPPVQIIARPQQEVIQFEIAGEPVPYRERAAFAKNKKFIYSYRPKNVIDAGKYAKIEAERAMGVKAPFTGAVALNAIFFMPIPASWSKKEKAAALNRFHIVKPDRTNLTKLLEDAFKGVIWADDSEVCAGQIYKVYSNKPRTLVQVQTIEGAVNAERLTFHIV